MNFEPINVLYFINIPRIFKIYNRIRIIYDNKKMYKIYIQSKELLMIEKFIFLNKLNIFFCLNFKIFLECPFYILEINHIQLTFSIYLTICEIVITIVSGHA